MSAKGNRYCKQFSISSLFSKKKPCKVRLALTSVTTPGYQRSLYYTTTQSSFSQGLKAAAQSDTLLSKSAALVSASFIVLSSSFVNVSVLFSQLHFESRAYLLR